MRVALALHSTLATIVIVADAPGASEEKVTDLLLPLPPQTPPPVALHDTNVVPAGRLSVTVTSGAGFGPLFVTTIVKVTFEPAGTELDDACFVIERSEMFSACWAITQGENSEVFPAESVAVAVIDLPD
jgi:hypothetical protein